MLHKIHISYPVLSFFMPPEAFLVDVRCFFVEPKAESAELKEPTR